MGGGDKSPVYQMMAQTGDNGIVNQANDAISRMDQELRDLRKKKLNPNGDYILPEDMNESQRDQWERSFQNDPDWRLNRDNTWSLVPIEPDSEAYKQGRDATNAATDNVMKRIKPGFGPYNPREVPMRGGHGDPSEWSTPIHFDPSRSGDQGLAQLSEVMRRMGVA